MLGKILTEYGLREQARTGGFKLTVVHPADKILDHVVAALDADDWIADFPMPFYNQL